MTGERMTDLSLSLYSTTFDVVSYAGEDEEEIPYVVRASFTRYADARAYVESDDTDTRELVCIRPPREWILAVTEYMAACVKA